MKVLGKLNFKDVLFAGVFEVLFTIFLCYILAVSLGHKEAWLPTISECGVYSPEKYFFRWGILAGGLLLCLEAVVLWLPKRISTVVFVLAFLAGLALSLVAVVSVQENYTVHMIFALGFFGLEDIAVVGMLCEGLLASRRTLAVRIPSVLVSSVATLARFAAASRLVDINDDVPWIAIIEWINVFALLAFHLSLFDDMDDLYVAALQDDKIKAAPTDTTVKLNKEKPISL